MAAGDVLWGGASGREWAVVEVPTAAAGVARAPGVVILNAAGAATTPATAANQVTELASLASIDGKTGNGVLTVLTSIQRPNDTTSYAINDAYADGAAVAGGFTFTGAVRASGKSAIITDLLIINTNPAATPLQGILCVFDTAITAIADNAAFGFSDAEALTQVAEIPFAMAVGANNNRVHLQNLGIGVTTVGSANLRFIVKVTNAYIPVAQETLSFRAKFLPVD